MPQFELVIEHTAGKENLLADALWRKHKYSLDSTEEQDFIPQSIDHTENNTEPQDTSITTNNLSISPIPEEFRIFSRGCINVKYTDCDYNKYAGRDESLEHHPSCLVCTTARVLGGHKSGRSAKIGQKTRPLTYLGNSITQIGQTDFLEFLRTL